MNFQDKNGTQNNKNLAIYDKKVVNLLWGSGLRSHQNMRSDTLILLAYLSPGPVRWATHKGEGGVGKSKGPWGESLKDAFINRVGMKVISAYKRNSDINLIQWWAFNQCSNLLEVLVVIQAGVMFSTSIKLYILVRVPEHYPGRP